MLKSDFLYYKKTPLKIVTLLCILFILISLQACKRFYHSRANVLEGYLHTPWGKFEFQQVSSAQQASDMKRYAWRTSWPGHLYADAGDVFVILSLTGQVSGFLGKTGSTYGHPNYSLDIKVSDTKALTEEKGFIGHLLKYDILDQKFGRQGFGEYYGAGFSLARGGGLNTPYNIVIPFNISGDDFLVDVWVEVTKEGYWALDIGVPAH